MIENEPEQDVWTSSSRSDMWPRADSLSGSLTPDGEEDGAQQQQDFPFEMSDAMMEVIAKELLGDLATTQQSEQRFVEIADDFDAGCLSVLSPPSSSSSFNSPMTTDNVDSPAEQSSSPTCKVCGQPAGKHSYYGGKVCNSCRAFFRRAVQSGSHENFACARGGQTGGACQINSRSWKSCQRCRFDKCLSAGMKTGWVLSDSERRQRMEKRSQLKQQRTGVATTCTAVARTAPTCSMIKSVSNELMTMDEANSVVQLHETMMEYVMGQSMKLYAVREDILDCVLSALFKGYNIPYSSIQTAERYGMCIVRSYYSERQDLFPMTCADRNAILTENAPLVLEFIQSGCYDTVRGTKQSMQLMRDFMVQHASQDDLVRHVLDKWNSFCPNSDVIPERAIRYEQVYTSPWLESQQSEDRHRRLTNRIKSWILDGEDSPIDQIQVMLMGMVMLFSTDNVRLQNPKAVEAVQNKYTVLLLKYLKTKYGQERAMTHFCNGMATLSLAREAYALRSKRLPV